MSDAHAITMVTDEEMSTTVLNAARGTLRIEAPRGQVGAPVRRPVGGRRGGFL